MSVNNCRSACVCMGESDFIANSTNGHSYRLMKRRHERAAQVSTSPGTCTKTELYITTKTTIIRLIAGNYGTRGRGKGGIFNFQPLSSKISNFREMNRGNDEWKFSNVR